MPLVHLLTGGPDLRQCAIACGARLAQCASPDLRQVTCPACLAPPCRRTVNASMPSGHTSGLTEKAWLQQVIALARQRGYLVYHPHNSQKSAPGWPDVVLARAGSPLYLIELKTTHGALSGHQRHWLETLRRTDGLVVEVWRPEDWDTVVQVLAR
jgi:hypothetical protein